MFTQSLGLNFLALLDSYHVDIDCCSKWARHQTTVLIFRKCLRQFLHLYRKSIWKCLVLFKLELPFFPSMHLFAIETNLTFAFQCSQSYSTTDQANVAAMKLLFVEELDLVLVASEDHNICKRLFSLLLLSLSLHVV